jgi:hypothetical protein
MPAPLPHATGCFLVERAVTDPAGTPLSNMAVLAD